MTSFYPIFYYVFVSPVDPFSLTPHVIAVYLHLLLFFPLSWVRAMMSSYTLSILDSMACSGTQATSHQSLVVECCADTLSLSRLWYYDGVPTVCCPSTCLSLLTNCPYRGLSTSDLRVK